MNPERYPNPTQFIPERFEKHTLSMTSYLRHPDPLQRDHFAFGGGRRSVSRGFVMVMTPFEKVIVPWSSASGARLVHQYRKITLGV